MIHSRFQIESLKSSVSPIISSDCGTVKIIPVWHSEPTEILTYFRKSFCLQNLLYRPPGVFPRLFWYPTRRSLYNHFIRLYGSHDTLSVPNLLTLKHLACRTHYTILFSSFQEVFPSFFLDFGLDASVSICYNGQIAVENSLASAKVMEIM